MSLDSIQLGNFVLDLRQQSLVHRGESMPLRPKTLLVLRHLAEHPGALLSTDDLHANAWPGLAVTPQTLTNVISELRRMTRRDPDASLRIETRYGRGYRLVVKAPAGSGPRGAEAVPALAAAPTSSIFVGRGPEMAQLRELWRRALGNERQIVFVAGSAGIGKTTLIEEAIASLRLDPPRQGAADAAEFAVGRGRCVVREGDTEAFAPLLDALEEISRGLDLTEDLRRCAPSWLAQMPWLLPADEMMALRQSLAGSGALRLLREGVKLFEEISRRLPVVLVLEDLHGADASTIDLLAALSERPTPARLLVLASYRPSDAFLRGGLLPALPRRALRAAGVTRLVLDPLSPAAIDAYLERRFSGSRFDASIASALEEKSGGNPLFLGELADTLVERGWLVEDGDGWSFAAPADALGTMLPDGVRELIHEHLEQLRADRIEILEAASAVGADFTVSLVAAALERPAEDIARECRALAAQSHFVAADGERAMPDGSVVEAYRFTHALYQQALGERLTPSLRRPLHARLGDQLEREYASRTAEIAPRLALHFEVGEQREKQLAYLQLAAMGAGARQAYRETADFVRRAIEVTRLLPDSRDNALHRAELLLAYGNIEMMVSGYGDANVGAAYDLALEEATRHGDELRRFRAQLGRSVSALFRASPEADAITAELRATADAGHPELVSIAYLYSAYVRHGRGDFTAFLAEMRKSESLLPQAIPGVPQNICLEAHVEAQLARGLTVAGEADEAALHRDRCVAWLRQRAIPPDRMASFANLAATAMIARDAEATLAFADESIAIGEEYGIDRLPLPMLGFSCRAWARCALGGGTIEDFAETIEQRFRSGEAWFQVHFLLALAELQIRGGRLESARATLDRCAASKPRDVEWLAEEQRLAGELLLAQATAGQGSPAASAAGAARHFDEAMRLAREQGAFLFEARALAAKSR